MLGERLLRRGAISVDQLESALQQQQALGGLLGDVLRRLNFVSEDDLSQGLADEAAVPFVRLKQQSPNAGAAALVPEPFARRHLIVPLGFRDDELEVLQVNPFDVIAVDEVQRLAGRQALVACGTRTDVLRMIERTYRGRAAAPDASGEPRPSRAAERAPAPDIGELGMTRRHRALVGELLRSPRGLLVITGPGGAGITTTIGAVMRERADATFVGELPEAGPVPPGLSAARAEDFVVASFPGIDAGRAARRLLALELAPASREDEIVAVVAQRLVRLVCPHCAARTGYPADVLARAGLSQGSDVALYRGAGCDRCGGSGYLGCTAVFEILDFPPGRPTRVETRPDPAAVRQAAIAAGMRTLGEHALALAIFGRIPLEEVLKVVGR
jgi:type II secretory ATPase GspE/PulE/Tfp pilus assembly ATPase PilB-like protein